MSLVTNRCARCGKEMGTSATCGCIYRPPTETPPLQSAGLMGWTCPRCGTVHSPFVLHCDCPPPYRISTDNVTEEWSP